MAPTRRPRWTMKRCRTQRVLITRLRKKKKEKKERKEKKSGDADLDTRLKTVNYCLPTNESFDVAGRTALKV